MPILPFLFDHPVERATDAAFDWIEGKVIEREVEKKREEL